MKRILRILILTIGIFCFAGCGSDREETLVQVSVMETDGVSVSDNGLWISPGSDAVFRLRLPENYVLASTDYAGAYELQTSGNTVILTLRNVRVPTRVRLELVSNSYTVYYHGNGGRAWSGGAESVPVSYSLIHHARPNTSIGTDLFHREGYTLKCWNTEPDGSGLSVGLGSRVTVEAGIPMDLYAQWVPWTDSAAFDTVPVEGGVAISAYHGSDGVVVIPETLDGNPVVGIRAGAFKDKSLEEIVFSKTLVFVEDGAFQNCGLRTVTLFDNIESIKDGAFMDCNNLQTLHINAVEAPYGYLFRRESVYADKIDLLILAQGQKKLVFYGGCSMWYNLDGPAMQNALGDSYRVINTAINGTVSSLVQMQILEAYMEEWDILFHTPELSSRTQLCLVQEMRDYDEHLWCGLEYNYDLFSLVDIRGIDGVFDSLTYYLTKKDGGSRYEDTYQDSEYQTYLDSTGSIPFFREQTYDDLADDVFLNPDYIQDENMEVLDRCYEAFQAKGVRVYVSYACVNMDAVPDDQKGNVARMDALFRDAVEKMDGPVLISRLEDFLYNRDDFYDTNYHLLSQPAYDNTVIWIRDLLARMEQDGLGEGIT